MRSYTPIKSINELVPARKDSGNEKALVHLLDASVWDSRYADEASLT